MVLKQEGDWFFIKMDFDGYEGWLSKSSVYWSEAKPISIVVTNTDESVNVEKTTDLSSLPEPEIENSVNNQVAPI